GLPGCELAFRCAELLRLAPKGCLALREPTAPLLQPGQPLRCSAELHDFEPLRLDRCRPLFQFGREPPVDLLRPRRFPLSFRKRPEARHDDTPCTRQPGLVLHVPIELLLSL